MSKSTRLFKPRDNKALEAKVLNKPGTYQTDSAKSLSRGKKQTNAKTKSN